MFHSTCANARTSLETPCRSLIHSIDLPSESDLPNKYPRLLDSACACGLVDHSQVAISDPAAEFLAVAFAFRCARPHGFNLSLPRHLSLLLLLLPIDSICGRSHCLKTPIYNSAVPNGPFVPLSTKNLDLYALLNGRRKFRETVLNDIGQTCLSEGQATRPTAILSHLHLLSPSQVPSADSPS